MKYFEENSSVYISLGGAGANIMRDFNTHHFPSHQQLYVNTDRRALYEHKGANLLIGEGCAKGRSCLRDSELGKQSIDESILQILAEIKNAKNIFIIAGAGGGTGSASPHLAKLLSNNGKKVFLIISLLNLDCESSWTHMNVERTVCEAKKLEPAFEKLLILKQDWSLTDRKAPLTECLLEFHHEISKAILKVRNYEFESQH